MRPRTRPSVVMIGGAVTGDGHVTISYPLIDVPVTPPPPQDLSFEATGQSHQFQVPAGVTTVRVDAGGAQGGGTYGASGAGSRRQ